MFIRQKIILILILLIQAFVLSSCKLRSCNNSYDENYSGSVKVGNPYTIKSKTYEPKLDHQYDEVGTASWYGDDFHCKKTANGEYFNKHQLSAAHNTLPLPSVVKVTNLENNRSVNVVINDRGPFSKKRIIDVSEKAAISLGMKSKGLATVRIQFLPKETNELMAKIASKKKIYYKSDSKHKLISKFEVVVAEYTDQEDALTTMHKLSKIGKVHLIVGSNHKFKVVLAAANKEKAKILFKKVKNLGYSDAKIYSHR